MLPAIEYHRPASLPEACALLAQLGGDGVALAGGTDVLPDLGRGALNARHLVSLRDLGALRGIRADGDTLRIGALATPADLAASEAVRSLRPELLDAVGAFAAPQVRNMATVGGNLCTAASCSDLAPLLVALGATVHLVGGQDGERDVAVGEFFVDVRRTVLAPGELLTEVAVLGRRRGEGARYEVFGRRAAAFITVAGVAAWVRMEDGVCRAARVVLGAVAPTPLLVPAAGAALVGGPLDAAARAGAAPAARAAALPISDVRGSAEHRRDLVEVLTRRALEAARERSGR